MNFINSLTKHKIVEPNKLAGLINGHMIAQAPFRDAVNLYLDNGVILFLDEKAELVIGSDANAKKKQPFLHYTEELMNGPVNGSEYFTVDIENGLCYPRAIALYEGDEFTTNNFSTEIGGGLVADTKYFAYVDFATGDFEVVDAEPANGGGLAYVGPLFVAEKDTLAAGQAAVRLTLIDKMITVTA